MNEARGLAVAMFVAMAVTIVGFLVIAWVML